jgi:photosystem II stability/assembly factor-like uncharacterized protein
LQLSPNYASDRTIFIGSYGYGVYRSTNDGSSWAHLTGSLQPHVTDLDISPGYPGDPTLFVTVYNDGVFRSDNGGATWTSLGTPGGSCNYIVELSPAFPQDGTLFAANNGTSGGGAFRSGDRGEHWADITGGALTYFVSAVAVSPRFAQDQTVIMGKESGPLYISENAGETWFPLAGIPVVGEYGLTITYEDGFLMPLAATPSAVYRYWWPSGASAWPSSVGVALEPGSTEPVVVQLHLASGDAAQERWEVSENADWLTATPVSGTMPATVNLTVDPTRFTDTVRTALTVQVYWSLQQSSTISVPVVAFFAHHRVRLPLVMRGGSSQADASARDEGQPGFPVGLDRLDVFPLTRADQ